MAKKTNNFFRDLRRLFSASVVIQNSKNQQRVINLNKLNTNSQIQKNFYQQPYNIRKSSGYNSPVNDTNGFQLLRSELYKDYESMDKDGILSTALDIYSDEACTRNVMGDILTIKCDNIEVKKSLENLYNNVLNISFNLWSWIRNLVKYGDFMLKLDIVEQVGVIDAHPLSIYAIERVEDNGNISFIYNMSIGQIIPTTQTNYNYKSSVTFEEYEVAHFRLLNDTNYLPYGRSMLEPARKEWKRLVLMEDAMLISRIMRAPERRIFKIDVGNLPTNEIETHINNVMNNLKKTPYIDPNTGEYNLQFNIQNLLEDFVIPVRGGNSGTEIDTLPGLEFNAIDDIEYLRNKLLASLKIPKAFLGFDETTGDKATLSSQDVRFSKTVEKIQRIIESELIKIGIVHLYTQKFSENDIYTFGVQLTKSSQIAELERLEVLDQRINIANSSKDLKLFSQSWMYENIFNLSEDEMKKEKNRIVEDTKFAYRIGKIETDGDDPIQDKKIQPEPEVEENINDSYEKKIYDIQKNMNNHMIKTLEKKYKLKEIL